MNSLKMSKIFQAWIRTARNRVNRVGMYHGPHDPIPRKYQTHPIKKKQRGGCCWKLHIIGTIFRWCLRYKKQGFSMEKKNTVPRLDVNLRKFLDVDFLRKKWGSFFGHFTQLLGKSARNWGISLYFTDFTNIK